ncbi:MAG: hypothetical protein IJY25_03060 [Bacilli bacterium]|nr:hypothetical protein [Bacilli bacterium]
MNYSILDFIIIGSIILIPELIFDIIIRPIYRKKANYNCDKCKLWDCPYKECSKKKTK